ncbi:hypothetical protein FF098_016240 [Parvularcula flava]|uniref:DUF2946 domain-containing protein n=1 Tax=Aquisalinus luteolus TaxID=1566827 RepID=A0A8J3EQE2_9PROT|nr:DUF2946 family protein [Aquisalinus luteolus]NHK29462.1 hypothetical protein [Aquisalinus luteolus]GGI01871.1 hypothetical protein GCM10011355_33530 [Aquisalinus luteolus]
MRDFRIWLLRMMLLAFAVQAGFGGAAMARLAEHSYSICSPSGTGLTAEAKAAAREFAALTTRKDIPRNSAHEDQCFLCHLAASPALTGEPMVVDAPARSREALRPLENAAIAALPQGPPLGGRAPPAV